MKSIEAPSHLYILGWNVFKKGDLNSRNCVPLSLHISSVDNDQVQYLEENKGKEG